MYRNNKKDYNLKKAERYIGHKIGELTIQSITGMKEYGGAFHTFVLCRCSCGKQVEAPLSQILAGNWNSCGHARLMNLEKAKHAHAEGTYLYALNADKNIQSNNSTGHTGVSMRKGKYRAYINFKGKQYHLGTYGDMDDAVAARKDAEKEIFGSFLEWYEENHPEEWEKIKSRFK